MNNSQLIPIELIDRNPYQPRQHEDPEKVKEIAASILKNTLLQVPVGRRVDGRYQLAFGHTRLAAFKHNGEDCMPLEIRQLDDLQMFEMAVAENIKRKDLNPIEQAEAMQRYMEEFGKNAKEAAEFFNVSHEQVRATVRLRDLPPEAQKAVASGDLNISGARAILSLQKIASEKAVEQLTKRLAAGTDRWGHAATTEAIISSEVQQLEQSVRMWNDDREGKPRSTQEYNREGWLISMKNFPNKLLPALTWEELAVALEIGGDNEAIARANTFLMWKRGQMDLTDEQLEELQMPPEQVVKIVHLLNPPACSACPFYTRVNGTHLCGMKACHSRKMIAWQREKLEAAVRDLGIPLYSEKDGRRAVLESFEKGDQALFEQRHADLRLVPKDEIKGYHYQTFSGLNSNVAVVVMVGESFKNRDALRRQAIAVEKQSKSLEERIEEMHKRGRRLLEWEAARHAKVLFEGFNLQALEMLREAAFHWSIDEDDVPEGAAVEPENAAEDQVLDFRRQLLALSMLDEAIEHDMRNVAKLAAYAAHLIEILTSWKIRKPRKLIEHGEELDAEIDALKKERKSKKGGQ